MLHPKRGGSHRNISEETVIIHQGLSELEHPEPLVYRQA